MSLIGDLSTNIALLVDKLNEYDEHLEKAEVYFKMENKKLETLCKQHPGALSFYDRRLGELKSIEDLIQQKVKEIESNHWKRYNEKYPRTLSTADIRAYISGEKDYNEMYEVLLEVINMRRQYEAVVDGLKQMGWTLNNIVKLRVAQLELIEL
jgi:hypothetical protein